jgi:D-galactarolactone cycloisomerase
MKIIAASSVLLGLPYRTQGPDIIAGRPSTHINALQIRVETEDGIVGWGEAFGHALAPVTQAAFDTLVAPLLIGQDSSDIAATLHHLHTELHLFGRNGAVTYALSGVDVALWDIAGKRAGLPLYQLLGAAPRETVPAYASLLRCGAAAPLTATCEAALAKGYQQVKLHEIEPWLVGVARSVLGPDIALMVDTNCPWSLDEARSKATAMRPFNLEWLEEPIFPPEDRRSLASLREVGVPIAAGENVAGVHEFQAMFEAKALDVAQPSVIKIGGVTAMLEVARLAAAYDVRLQPHCFYFGSGYLASLHLSAFFGGRAWFESPFVDLIESPFSPFDVVTDGHATLPQGPGLGSDPDPESLARYTIAAN